MLLELWLCDTQCRPCKVQRLGWLVGGLGARLAEGIGGPPPTLPDQTSYQPPSLCTPDPPPLTPPPTPTPPSARAYPPRFVSHHPVSAPLNPRSGGPKTGLAGRRSRSPDQTKFFLFHNSKLSGRIRPTRFGCLALRPPTSQPSVWLPQGASAPLVLVVWLLPHPCPHPTPLLGLLPASPVSGPLALPPYPQNSSFLMIKTVGVSARSFCLPGS